MHNIHRAVAPKLIARLGPPPFCHLLDVGGASGTWTLAFLAAGGDEATATIFDLPDVIPMAEARIAAAGLANRVNFVGGDYNADDLPAGADLVCMAGFLSLWHIPPQYDGRVMNIHPALLPSFGGKGYYGHAVHEAALAAGVKVSGCTVHFVNSEYDAGPIIVQRPVPVAEGDTPETLAARVFEQECIAYVEAIRLFAEGRLRIDNNVVHVAPAGD